MNHKSYFYNPYIILKTFHYVTFRAQTWPQHDLSFWSKSEVEYFKKSYLMNHRRYFYNFYIILKIYHYITLHTQTWP